VVLGIHSPHPLPNASVFYGVLGPQVDFVTPLREGQLCSEDLSNMSFAQQRKRASRRAPTPACRRKIGIGSCSAPSRELERSAHKLFSLQV